MDVGEAFAPAEKRQFCEVSVVVQTFLKLKRRECQTQATLQPRFGLEFWRLSVARAGHTARFDHVLAERVELLCRFSIGVRNKNGQSSYLAAGAAISRHVVVELNKPDSWTCFARQFSASQTTFWTGTWAKKLEGNEPAVEHKLSVSDEDFERLKVYFDDAFDSPDAVKLSFFCWYNLTLHCAFRSSEVQVALKKEDIVFANDAEGGTNATIWRDFLSKNCRGGIDGREFEIYADVFKKHGSSLPSISINVQGVPRRKKQESRLELKRKV